jgi:hypothetical protein
MSEGLAMAKIQKQIPPLRYGMTTRKTVESYLCVVTKW